MSILPALNVTKKLGVLFITFVLLLSQQHVKFVIKDLKTSNITEFIFALTLEVTLMCVQLEVARKVISQNNFF